MNRCTFYNDMYDADGGVRFVSRGQAAAIVRVPAESPDAGAPCTLDLRRAPGGPIS